MSSHGILQLLAQIIAVAVDSWIGRTAANNKARRTFYDMNLMLYVVGAFDSSGINSITNSDSCFDDARTGRMDNGRDSGSFIKLHLLSPT